MAERLARAIGADLHEITSAQPYTRADLNWNDPKSRSSVEMNDPTSRPPIADTVQNMAAYDTIFVGFPIWWYTAPAIIKTFLEQYDLSGKTIVPFATSGGSGIGHTADDLRASAPNATIKNGERLNVGTSPEKLKTWAENQMK